MLCFEPLPRHVLSSPGPLRLTTPAERRRIIFRSGVSGVEVMPFDETTRSADPAAFLDSVLEAIGFDRLVVGYDFGFGRGRAGTVGDLTGWCGLRGIALEVVGPVRLDGVAVKSGAIRRMVSAGDLREAARMLGRDYSALGAVARGKGLGTSLGFPTLNLAVPAAKLLPPPGSYRARIVLDGREMRAAAFVPRRHAAARGGTGLCEAHVPGWSGDAYAAAVELVFEVMLRPPEDGLDRARLSERIARDVARVMEEGGG